MSVSAAESLAYFYDLTQSNTAPETVARRLAFQSRSRRFGKYGVHTCIDSRDLTASTLDPGRGPVLIPMQSFGGIASPERFTALSTGLVRGLFGHIFVSHGAGDKPHPEMGLDDCGARHASAKMRAGEEVLITGAPLIRDEVDPDCIVGALNRAKETSRIFPGPSVAMSLDHVTQRPHLLGIAENGRWKHMINSTSTLNGIPEIDPDIIRDEYPHIAGYIEQGKKFSRSQTPAEIESRRKQDPKAVWVSGNLYPTWDVWGTIPLGEMMRITYARHSREYNYLPRDQEIKIVNAHLSYPYAQASGTTPAFPSTNLTIIDGKTPHAINAIFEGMQRIPETSAWLDAGPRVVMGVIMRAGNIEDVKRLH